MAEDHNMIADALEKFRPLIGDDGNESYVIIVGSRGMAMFIECLRSFNRDAAGRTLKEESAMPST
jgi:hypothetical protein